MATFPESSPSPQYPLQLIQRWATSIVELGGDTIARQTRSSCVFPVYDAVVTYKYLSLSDIHTLWNFYKARRGPYEAFYIYDLASVPGDTLSHVGEYCGVGDASETTFDIPGRSTSNQSVYVSGVLQTITTDYTISAGTGDSSADQIVFEAGSIPAAGANVTCDFYGHLRCRVGFEAINFSRESFGLALARTGQIKLIGREAVA